MTKRCSKAVEVLPSPTIAWLCGSVKTSTARICKNGRNIVIQKVKQPNKTGADPGMFTGAGEKWRSMTEAEKKPWKDMVMEKSFRSGWNAFISSFLRSVAIYGLEYTMNHELTYFDSNIRQQKAEQLNNSLIRLENYEIEPNFYEETENVLTEYPVAFSNEHVYLRLRDLVDVNNALAMKWLYRTDDFTEYQFTPIETNQYTETGSYILTERPRQGQELFQPIDIPMVFLF